MFLEHLSLSYNCSSSIGNSLDLKKMLDEVLYTFVTLTNANTGAFFFRDDENNLYKYIDFDKNFDENIEDYDIKCDTVTFIDSTKDPKNGILVIPTKNGDFYLIYKKSVYDPEFHGSMFQDLVVKLNISIDACLNMQRLKSKNNQLDKLAHRLEDQKKQLEEANKYQTNFLANISHELKTPLNSIIILSNLMSKNKDNNLTDKNLKNIKIINSSGNDLLNLINDILDVSKIEAGEIALNLRKVNIIELIDEIFHQMLPIAKDKGLNLSRIYNVSDSLVLFTDEGRIKQIVKNLLSNAIKFTHDGEVVIDLSMNDENISIKIIDQGIGIEHSKLNTIFERFKQADGSTTRKYGGTGLGLSVSKELTELLNGTLNVESTINEGSTFELTLPVKTNISNISDEKVSLGTESDNKIEEIVLFDDFDFEEEKPEEKNEKPHILFINNDHIMFFSQIIKLQKEGIEVDKSDNLDIINMSKVYDLIVINDNFDKQHILEFLEEINYSSEKILIISNDNYDINNTLSHNDVKDEFINTIKRILGLN